MKYLKQINTVGSVGLTPFLNSKNQILLSELSVLKFYKSMLGKYVSQLVIVLFSFHVGNLYNIANYHIGKY